MPIAAGKIDRVGKEGRFVERNVDFKPHVPREACFGEQQIAAACSAANCKIALGHANLRKRVGNCSGGNRLFARGKSCCLSIWRVDHVAAEEEYGFRRLVGLNCRHRDTIGSRIKAPNLTSIAECALLVEESGRRHNWYGTAVCTENLIHVD